MAIARSERLRGPLSAQLRAALYYARKRRLARLQGGSGGGSYSQNLYTGFIHLEGGADLDASSKIEFSAWVNVSLPGSEQQWLWADGNDTQIMLETDGTLRVKFEATGSILYHYRTHLAVQDGALSHIYVSYDAATGTPEIIIDGVTDDLTSGTVFTAATAGTIHAGVIDLLALNGAFRDFEGEWGDLWVNNPASFDGHAAFWNGGTPPDLSGLTQPVIWLGGDQVAADISAGGNNGTATLTPRAGGALTDVGAPPAPGHRYWRILCQDGQNTSFYGIAELEFRESLGGADETTSGQAIFGGERVGFEATKAFDNITTTNNSWGVSRSDPADTHWVGQDFGAGNEKEIVQIVMTARADSFFNQTPKDFELQSSDDLVSWTTELAVVADPNWSAGESRTYNV